LETTNPASHLFYGRGLVLAKYLREHMAEEEQEFMAAPLVSCQIPFDADLIRQRQHLLADIDRLVTASALAV